MLAFCTKNLIKTILGSSAVLALPIIISSPLGVGCVVTHRKSLEGGGKTQHTQLGVINTNLEDGYKTQHAQLGVANTSMEGGCKKC